MSNLAPDLLQPVFCCTKFISYFLFIYETTALRTHFSDMQILSCTCILNLMAFDIRLPYLHSSLWLLHHFMSVSLIFLSLCCSSNGDAGSVGLSVCQSCVSQHYNKRSFSAAGFWIRGEQHFKSTFSLSEILQNKFN